MVLFQAHNLVKFNSASEHLLFTAVGLALSFSTSNFSSYKFSQSLTLWSRKLRKSPKGMLSHLVCYSSSFSLSPQVKYVRSALLDEKYLLLLLSSSLAGLLQTLFWSVGVCLSKMACFHIRTTYATSQVSIVLDMYIYWWDGIFLSWHHSKGKKKSLLGRIWSFTGKRGMTLSSVRYYKNTDL